MSNDALKSISSVRGTCKQLHSISEHFHDGRTRKVLRRCIARGSFANPPVFRSLNRNRATERHVQECLSLIVDLDTSSKMENDYCHDFKLITYLC